MNYIETLLQEARTKALMDAANIVYQAHRRELIGKGRNPDDYSSQFSHVYKEILDLKHSSEFD